MPIRIPTHTIVVLRDGQRIEPQIGRPFEFTDSEIADIEKSAATDTPFDDASMEAAKSLVADSKSEAAKPAGKGKGKAADADDL